MNENFIVADPHLKWRNCSLCDYVRIFKEGVAGVYGYSCEVRNAPLLPVEYLPDVVRLEYIGCSLFEPRLKMREIREMPK